MEYIPMIMSGLALLAAVVSLVLIISEKKRNQKRNADFINYVDAETNSVNGRMKVEFEQAVNVARDALVFRMQELQQDIIRHSVKIEQLEKGIVPDYNEALAAKNSVDDFNRGLSAIMGYDPIEMARKAREEKMYGGEVK